MHCRGPWVEAAPDGTPDAARSGLRQGGPTRSPCSFGLGTPYDSPYSRSLHQSGDLAVAGQLVGRAGEGANRLEQLAVCSRCQFGLDDVEQGVPSSLRLGGPQLGGDHRLGETAERAPGLAAGQLVEQLVIAGRSCPRDAVLIAEEDLHEREDVFVLHGLRDVAVLADKGGEGACGCRLGVEVAVAVMGGQQIVQHRVHLGGALVFREISAPVDEVKELLGGASLGGVGAGAEAAVLHAEALPGIFADLRPELRPQHEDVVGDDRCAAGVGIEAEQAGAERVGAVSGQVLEERGGALDVAWVQLVCFDVRQKPAGFCGDGVVRQGDDLPYAGLQPRGELHAGQLHLVGVSRAGVVPHVADVVDLGVARGGEQADLSGGPQQVDVVDLDQVVLGRQVLAPVVRRNGDVEEVGQVVAGYPPAQLADRLVPQVVQRRVEEPRRSGGDHLAHVHRPSAVGHRQPSQGAPETRERLLAFHQIDQDTVRRQAGISELIKEHLLEPLEVLYCRRLRISARDLVHRSNVPSWSPHRRCLSEPPSCC
ncbi:hypothetical protein SCOCK_580040 [Actinacidiphila cocklensis]|uniref:Uncharacterized protein n=1 Tax=Actinacidiphila cocklensis TaxID=887465 RepID=A0A9W4GWD7_9ACTN|nr:hypothetical protein SCOCK_580040 [Actinacidiphila cocklensis]